MGAKRICYLVLEPSLAIKSEHHARIRDRGGGGAGSGIILAYGG